MSGLGTCKECGNPLIPFKYEIEIVKKIHELQGMKCSSSSCDYKFPSEAKEKIRQQAVVI
jgi:RNase P subunit RPR2